MQLLNKFVLEISIKYPNIGFRALHYFQSWSEDATTTENSYVSRADDFYNLLEGALVNQDLPKQYKTYAPKVLEMNEYFDKQFKADYMGL